MKWAGRIGRALLTVARYLLALGMMPYGISKLFQAQFQVFASSYIAELGSLDGASLTWAFLGRSPTFELHSGANGGGPLDELRGTYEATGVRLTLTGTRDGKTVRVVLRPWNWETKAPGSASSAR